MCFLSVFTLLQCQTSHLNLNHFWRKFGQAKPHLLPCFIMHFSASHSDLCPTSCVIPVLSCLPQLHLLPTPIQTNSKLSAILIGLVTGWGWSYYPATHWSHMLRKAEKMRDGLSNHSYQLSKSGSSTTIPFSPDSHISILSIKSIITMIRQENTCYINFSVVFPILD